VAALIAASLATPASATSPAGDPPKVRELKVLRALLVIDTKSDLADSVAHDRNNMKSLLEDHVPAERRTIDLLVGTKVTREEILKYYRDLKTGPDEALLFFYAGHGAIDPKLGPCFQPQMNNTPLVPRSEVRKAMEQTGAGAVILLTDCCSTLIPAKREVADREPTAAAGPKVVLHPVIRCLFFQHRGTVDITAAEDGTGAYGDDQRGGVFTRALVRLLEGSLKSAGANKDGFVSWKEFFPRLSRETENEFRDFTARVRAQGQLVDQKTQRPRSFALGEPPDKEPSTPAAKTYAVVSLRNDTGKPVRYRYRWAGETGWKDGTVPEKGKVFHELALADGAKAPDFEVEAEAGTEKGKATLKPAKWTGKGKPAYKDGQEHNINSR
jgi:hypothetical protein